MKNRSWKIFLALSLFLGLSQVVAAGDCEFEFYYQRIEKVQQINNPDPSGWWEKTKSAVVGGVNWVKKQWEKGVTRNFFPGEGEKTWYSEKDPNIAYKVKRFKVADEKHLLELMGVKSGEEHKLSNGQRALLASYRHSKSQAIKDRMQYAFRSKVKVILSDTTGFENEMEYPNVTKDFWPYSSGFMIQLNSKRYNYHGSEEDARSTFVHEFAHTLDHTFREIGGYGKDGTHFANEKTKPRTAFLEGFAEFNEMLDSRNEARSVQNAIRQIRVENKKNAGSYTDMDPKSKDLTGKDLTEVEGINANIMYRLATEVPGGKDRVFKAFKSTNYPWRSLDDFLRKFVKQNPAYAKNAARILNEETYGKLSDKEMKDFLGDSGAVRKFLADGRSIPTGKPEESSGVTPTGTVSDDTQMQPGTAKSAEGIDLSF